MIALRLMTKEVEIGSKVYVQADNRRLGFTIVPEVDEYSSQDQIAADSLLGRSLLGHREGDEFPHTLFDGSSVMIRVLSVGKP